MFIRPAEPEDAIAVARVQVRSWQAAYRTLLPDDYLDQLRPEDRDAQYDFASLDPLKPRTIVAVEKNLIVGFATTTPARDPDLLDYEELWVLEGNVRAEGFYRIDQWMPDGLRRTDSVWGIMVNQQRYQRRL